MHKEEQSLFTPYTDFHSDHSGAREHLFSLTVTMEVMISERPTC